VPNVHHTTLGLIPGNRVALQQVSLQISLVLPLLNISAAPLRSHVPEVYNSHDQEAQSLTGRGWGEVASTSLMWQLAGHTAKHKESCPYAHHNGVNREQRYTSNHS